MRTVARAMSDERYERAVNIFNAIVMCIRGISLGGVMQSSKPQVGNNNLKIRAFDWHQDWRALLQLIYESWFFEDSPSVGIISAAQFGLHYIAQATNCLVAQNAQGKLVGLLAINNKVDRPALAKQPWAYKQCHLLERASLCLLYLMPKAKVSRLFNDLFAGNYKRLRRMYEHAAWPEFTLLIVSPHAKRQGIGRKLTAAGEQLLKQQGFEHYYLLTDSSCDYQFYDRQGMKRVVDVSMDFTLRHIKDFDHYLCSYLHCYVYEQDLKAKDQVTAAATATTTATATATATGAVEATAFKAVATTATKAVKPKAAKADKVAKVVPADTTVSPSPALFVKKQRKPQAVESAQRHIA